MIKYLGIPFLPLVRVGTLDQTLKVVLVTCVHLTLLIKISKLCHW